MSLYSELSEQIEILENELIMLEKKLVSVQGERDLKKKQLDDINKCLRALEEE